MNSSRESSEVAGDAATRGAPEFPATRWSEVERTQQPNQGAACEALNRLLTTYRAPVIRRLARRFCVRDDQAEDWFQEFVLRRILEGDLLARARRERGLFRTLLLTAAENHVRSEFRRAGAEKRHPRGDLVSWDALTDADREQLGPAEDERVMDDWARATLKRALELMEAACRAQGELARWEVFRQRCLAPLLEGTAPTPYKRLVASVGLKDPAQASNLLLTAKRMADRMLREAVAEYAQREAEIEAEVRAVRAALAKKPPRRW